MIKSKEKITGSLTHSNNDTSVCPVCNGTGYKLVESDCTDIYGKDTEGNPETCISAEPCPACNGGIANRFETVRERANIPQTFYNSDLSSFDWDIYRDNEGKKIDLSKRRKFVESFIHQFDKWEEKGLGLYLWSKMKGSGKTLLASCICNELMKSGAMTTKFVQASELINIAKSGNDKANNQYDRDPIELLCNCKLLVLDDIGQVKTGGQWYEDILFRIMDSRMNQKLVTVITSNLRISELQVDDRISDRIYKVCQEIPLPEYCVRAKETNEHKRDFFKEIGLME